MLLKSPEVLEPDVRWEIGAAAAAAAAGRIRRRGQHWRVFDDRGLKLVLLHQWQPLLNLRQPFFAQFLGCRGSGVALLAAWVCVRTRLRWAWCCRLTDLEIGRPLHSKLLQVRHHAFDELWILDFQHISEKALKSWRDHRLGRGTASRGTTGTGHDDTGTTVSTGKNDARAAAPAALGALGDVERAVRRFRDG